MSFEKLSTIAVAIVVLGIALFVVVPQIVDFASGFGAANAEACCGGDGGDGGGGGGGGSICEFNPTHPTCVSSVPASCDFLTASRTTVPHNGGNVTLSWGTSNATDVELNNGIGNVSDDGSRNVFVNRTITYTLTVAGTGGEDSCSVTITVSPPPAQPAVCDFLTASRTTVPHGGGNVTLSWGTTNATSVSINNGVGTVSADGSRTVFVNSNRTFTLTATGAGGNDTCAVTITVSAPEPAAECDFFTASRTTVPHNGGNVTLSWGTTNATNVSINQGIGNVSDDGSTTVFVGSAKTFTLTATGAGGNDTCAVTVTLEDEPEPEAAECDFFSASDTHLPEGGGNVTLSWGTTNATDVDINNGIGDVSDDGSRNVFVDDTITYTLTATGAGGNDTCSVTITVEEDVDEPAPRCDSFTVSDDEVEEGDEVTLRWETTNADDVEINQGIGDVPDDGSRRVEIDDDTTFVLTARNNGEEDTCTVRVEVEEEEEDEEPKPRCELDISDRNVKVGDEVTLEWETENAEEVVIEDNRGKEIFEDENLSRRDDGEVDVVVTRDTEFTLTARGDGGKRECEVEVEVKDGEVLVLSERDQKPRVAGISLTQVPYTGFEAGPALTFLFYALLTAWALVVAYMLVIRKDTILGFSLAGATAARRTDTDVNEEESVEYIAPREEAFTPSVAAAPANLPTGTPVVGYSAYTAAVAETEEEQEIEAADDMKALEDHAHDRRVLFSSDALRYFRAHQGSSDEFAAFDRVIDAAKAAFPSEDGWIVINLARVEELMGASLVAEEQVESEVQPTGAGSLAEAIVTGNVVAAYQMIENRPMIALADAAAELDAVYRMYQGNATGTVAASDMLKTEVAKHSPEALKQAIEALTSALDGTYTDEASAVKMAIMKAVKAFA